MWSTFLDIVALAEKERAHFLFISGDLFEGNLITVGELKRINEAFQSIRHTHVVISPGNHDTYGEKTPYKLIDWAKNVVIFKEKEFQKIEFEDLYTNVYSFAWKEKYIENEFTFDLELDESKNNILILHGDIYNRTSNYYPIDQNYAKKLSFDYIALGHVHKPDILAHNIRYPGSPEPLDFGETGQRGVIVGEIENEKLQVSFVPMAKREFIVEQLILHPEMSYQEIGDKFKSYPGKEKHLYRFNLSGLIDSDIQIDELISEGCREFYHVEVNNQIYPDYNLEKIMLENTDNIIGAFIREMKKKDLEDTEVKNALYFGLQALLKEKVE